MKIGIIGAMSEEIEFLLNNLTNLKENKTGKHIFYTGAYAGNDIVVVRGGVGKVASGVVYATMLANYQDLELTVNVGSCGGLVGRVDIGDVIVPGAVGYADVDASFGGRYRYGQIPGYPPLFACAADKIREISAPPYRAGTILSGDSFFCDGEAAAELVGKHFPEDNVLAFDMESAALAQCAHFFNKDFLVIRSVSDLIGAKRQAEVFVSNLERASRACNEFLLSVLKNIK